MGVLAHLPKFAPELFQNLKIANRRNLKIANRRNRKSPKSQISKIASLRSLRYISVVVVVVYLYLTSAKCTGIAAFSLWPEATALTEMVKVELHERKKMKFYNV